MPTIIPIVGSDDTPLTKLFPAFASVNVGRRLETEPVETSVNVVEGEGGVVVYDVISEILDSARG
jgi:hypothetical protein